MMRSITTTLSADRSTVGSRITPIIEHSSRGCVGVTKVLQIVCRFRHQFEVFWPEQWPSMQAIDPKTEPCVDCRPKVSITNKVSPRAARWPCRMPTSTLQQSIQLFGRYSPHAPVSCTCTATASTARCTATALQPIHSTARYTLPQFSLP